jgi:ABC-type Mn2+/Zn2+ transport system permease subunit
VAYLAGSLLTGLGPIAVLLGLVGWAFLARRRSGLALALGTTAIACVVFAIGYNTTDSDKYTIPALIIFCVVIGCGVVRAVDDLRARWGHRALVARWTVIFVMLALSVLLHWSNISLREDHEAMLFGEKVM